MREFVISLDLCSSIKIEPFKFLTISIEDKHYFYSFVKFIKQEYKREDTSKKMMNVFCDGSIVNLEKMSCLITDYTEIDFNSKVINSSIIKKLTSFLSLSEQKEVRELLQDCLHKIIADFSLYSDLNLDKNPDLLITEIAKICAPTILDEKTTILERLIEYIDLMLNIKNMSVLFLVSVKLYLDQDELEMLFKYCLDRNLLLVLIESCDSGEILLDEQRVIIDSQKCVIFQNFDNSDEL